MNTWSVNASSTTLNAAPACGVPSRAGSRTPRRRRTGATAEPDATGGWWPPGPGRPGPHSGAFLPQLRNRHPPGQLHQPVFLGRVRRHRSRNDRGLRHRHLTASKRALDLGLLRQPRRGVQRPPSPPRSTCRTCGPSPPPRTWPLPCSGRWVCASRRASNVFPAAQPLRLVQDRPQLTSRRRAHRVRIQPIDQIGQPIPDLHRLLEHVFESTRPHRQHPGIHRSHN